MFLGSADGSARKHGGLLALDALLFECHDLAESGGVIGLAVEIVNQLGVVGEDDVVALVFLAACSRLLPKPVGCVLKAPSSAGKSHLARTVLSLLRPKGTDGEGDVLRMDSGSERALFYLDAGEQCPSSRHMLLYVSEASAFDPKQNDKLAHPLRCLLSDGRLDYPSVERRGKRMVPVRLQVEGPVGCVVTTTAEGLEPELETQLLSVRANATEDQSRRVTRARAVLVG